MIHVRQCIPAFLYRMKGPGAVFSGLLFVATFVLFPYVGMLLRITCSHNPTTDSQFQGRKTLLSAHPDYLHTGEIVGERHLVLFLILHVNV